MMWSEDNKRKVVGHSILINTDAIKLLVKDPDNSSLDYTLFRKMVIWDQLFKTSLA